MAERVLSGADRHSEPALVCLYRDRVSACVASRLRRNAVEVEHVVLFRVEFLVSRITTRRCQKCLDALRDLVSISPIHATLIINYPAPLS